MNNGYDSSQNYSHYVLESPVFKPAQQDSESPRKTIFSKLNLKGGNKWKIIALSDVFAQKVKNLNSRKFKDVW